MSNFQNIKIVVCDDYDELSKKSAEVVVQTIKLNPKSVIGFATGSTPEGLYKELIQLNHENALSFKKIKAFNLDEYYPIKKENPQSYYRYMQENLFSHIDIKPENCHIPNGETNDVPSECENYEKLIADCGGIDLQILGIGNNGHIGFNEPSAIFERDTRLVNLVESTIEANSRFFTSPREVPRYGITMGIKAIMLSKKIILLANGENKSGAIKRSLTGNIDPMVPASILQFHPDVTVFVEKSATKGLDL